MKNKFSGINVDNDGNTIDAASLIKSYPWNDTVKTFLFERYDINSNFRFNGTIDVYRVLSVFAEYLNQEQVLLPDVVTIVNFVSTVEISLQEMQKCLPIICDFACYCFNNYDEFFGGVFKDRDPVELGWRIALAGNVFTTLETIAYSRSKEYLEEEDAFNV